MFFIEKITQIGLNDKVLEIGPGSSPHPRANVFLDKKFTDENIAFQQRGETESAVEEGKIVFYEGDIFPFKDKEFDYVICSHVIEHVENVELFVNELIRVARKGYIEFPTIHYEYLYNFDVHLNFLLFKDEELLWMPKSETPLTFFKAVNNVFLGLLNKNIKIDLKCVEEFFFQGFEWSNDIKTRRVNNISDLCIDNFKLLEPVKKSKKTFKNKILGKIIYMLNKLQ